MKTIQGKVSYDLVDTSGGNFTYELRLDGESFERIFSEHVGTRIRVTIEEAEKTTCPRCEETCYVGEMIRCEECYEETCRDCNEFGLCKTCQSKSESQEDND